MPACRGDKCGLYRAVRTLEAIACGGCQSPPIKHRVPIIKILARGEWPTRAQRAVCQIVTSAREALCAAINQRRLAAASPIIELIEIGLGRVIRAQAASSFLRDGRFAVRRRRQQSRLPHQPPPISGPSEAADGIVTADARPKPDAETT